MGKAERTRMFITECVASLFNRKGYAGTSLSDLTRATGLTKGSIYGNFRNKDDVAVNAFKYNVSLIQNAIRAGLAPLKSSHERLSAYPGIFRGIFRDIIARGGCPIMNTLADADDTHPALHALSKRAVLAWRGSLEALVKEGMKAGEISGETDPRRVAETVIALLEGGLMLAKSTGSDGFMLNAIDQAEELIASIRA